MSRSSTALMLFPLVLGLGCDPEPEPVPDPPGELSVGCEDSAYRQIHSAARAAGAGDVVEVCSGTYEAGIIIDDAFALVAAEGAEVVVEADDDEIGLQIALPPGVSGTARLAGMSFPGVERAGLIQLSGPSNATIELQDVSAHTLKITGSAAYSIADATFADSELGWGIDAALTDGATVALTNVVLTDHAEAAIALRATGDECAPDAPDTLGLSADGLLIRDAAVGIIDVPDEDYVGIGVGCEAKLEVVLADTDFESVTQVIDTRWIDGPLHDMTLRNVTIEGGLVEGLTTSGAVLTIEGLTYTGAVAPLMTVDGVNLDVAAVSGLRLYNNTTAQALVRMYESWLAARAAPLECALCDMGTGDTANVSAELSIVELEGEVLVPAVAGSPWDFDGEIRWACSDAGCAAL